MGVHLPGVNVVACPLAASAYLSSTTAHVALVGAHAFVVAPDHFVVGARQPSQHSPFLCRWRRCAVDIAAQLPPYPLVTDV